jgi:phosphoglycerol transferase MdoB-like AlkP superfamily enzyme
VGEYFAKRRFRGTESQLFVVALVVPLIALDLAVTLSKVIPRFGDIAASSATPLRTGAAIVLYSMLGDFAFAFFACVILLVRAQGTWRWIATGIALQICAYFVALIDTANYAYFMQTLDALDAPLMRHMIHQPADMGLVMAGEVTFAQWFFLALVLAICAAGPWWVRAWARKRPIPPYPGPERRSRRRARMLVACCVPVAALGLLPPPAHVKDSALARAPILNLVYTAYAPAQIDPKVDQAVAESRVFEPGTLTIQRSGKGKLRNVVVVVLESTRAFSVTPYVPALHTTPFMQELSKKSLVVDKAYAVMPSTAKALTAIFCSLIPAQTIVPDALNEELLGRCLPNLLAEQGYQTVYLQTANPYFEARRTAVPAMGFKQFIKDDDMPHEGMQEANFLGFEDDAMLRPTEKWVHEHKDKPFFAAYLTVDAHHDYNLLTRHGVQHFATNGDDTLNRYLNNLYAQDCFLRSLFDIYKKEGTFENTLFVVVGDHGEGFGEHGRRAHNSVPYEEGLRVPMMFYDPGGTLFKPGHLPGPISQLDIVPTVLSFLGFKVVRGRMHGLNIFESPRERVLMSACLSGCATRITDTEAFIHHYDRRPDELYDLHTDPMERKDLAQRYPQIVARRQEDLLQFEKRIGSFFFMHELQAEHALREKKRRAESQQ